MRPVESDAVSGSQTSEALPRGESEKNANDSRACNFRFCALTWNCIHKDGNMARLCACIEYGGRGQIRVNAAFASSADEKSVCSFHARTHTHVTNVHMHWTWVNRNVRMMNELIEMYSYLYLLRKYATAYMRIHKPTGKNVKRKIRS